MCPSGLNATANDGVGVAGQGLAQRRGWAGSVTFHNRTVVVAGGGQGVPVGAERHPLTPSVWPVRGWPRGWGGPGR